MKRVAFHTFGCKLNFAETSSIARNLDALAFEIVDFRKDADIYVVHSCMVTANAERKTIAAIRQANHRNPVADIIVIGCMAELQKEKLLLEPGVKKILGNAEKFDLEPYINGDTLPPTVDGLLTFMPSWSIHERTRSFLKIQDGCDYFCAYCTIPLARGRSRSGTISEVVSAAREITASGAKEIVLTGVNIGDFGRHHKVTLYELLVSLLEIQGIERLRISSIEPDLLSDDVIDLAASESRFLPHFHIPLQAGSDNMLKRMKRKYDTRLFSDKVTRIRERLPDACIATDVIAGFPGETEESFNEGMQFIRSIDLSYMHVFTYSERQKTRAAEETAGVPSETRKARGRLLQEVSDEKKAKFYQRNLGTTRSVFFEHQNKKGFIFGFTENYIRVRHPWSKDLQNTIRKVRLDTLSDTDFYDITII